MYFSKMLFLIRTSFFLSPPWKNPWSVHESWTPPPPGEKQCRRFAGASSAWQNLGCLMVQVCLALFGGKGLNREVQTDLVASCCFPICVTCQKNVPIPTTSLGSRAIFHWAPGVWVAWRSLQTKSTCPVAACALWESLLPLELKTLKMFKKWSSEKKFHNSLLIIPSFRIGDAPKDFVYLVVMAAWVSSTFTLPWEEHQPLDVIDYFAALLELRRLLQFKGSMLGPMISFMIPLQKVNPYIHICNGDQLSISAAKQAFGSLTWFFEK